MLDLLGKGTFGQVVKCLDLEKNEFVAVKIVKNLPAFHSQGLVEVKLLQTLNSKYDSDIYPMVRMLDNFIFRNHLCLVFELLNVSLYELIRQNQFRGLSVQLVSIFTKQILTAMVALHQSRIIHCDLKPENILLEDATSPNLKVIDFGSACFDNQAVYTYIQSRFYRSPEVILGLPYKLSIDIWSLGCIVFELFIGLPLFPGLSQHRMLMRFIRFLGMPPYRMLIEAKDTSKFFNRVGYAGNSSDFVLKTDEEYSRHIAALTGNKPVPAQPFREYYKASTIQAIVLGYDMKPNLTREQKEEEMAMRRAMLSFIDCVLPWDPEERWTPEQLLTHPFITGKPCPEGRMPRPSKIDCDALNPLLQAQAISAERALAASSSMVVEGALVTLTQNVTAANASSHSSMEESPRSSNTPATSSAGTSNRMDSGGVNNTPSSYNSASPSRASSSGSEASSASSASSYGEAPAPVGVYGSTSETPTSMTGQRSSSFPAGSTGSGSGFFSAGSTPGATNAAAIAASGATTTAQLSVPSGARVQHQHPGPHQSVGNRQPAQANSQSSGSLMTSYGSRATSTSSSSSGSSAAMLLQSPSSATSASQFAHHHSSNIPTLATGSLTSSGRGGVPITPMKSGKVPALPGLGTSPSSSSSFMSGQSPMMGKLGLSPRDLQNQYQHSLASAGNNPPSSLMMLDESGTPTNMMSLSETGDTPISLSSSSSMSSPAHAIVELSHHTALDSTGNPISGTGKRGRSGNFGGSGSAEVFASVFDSPTNSPTMNTSSAASKRHKASVPSSPTGQAGRRHGSSHTPLNQLSPRYNATSGSLSIATDHPLGNFDDANMVTLMDVSSPMKPHWVNSDPGTSTLGGSPDNVFPSSTNQGGSQLQRGRFAGTDMVVDFNYMGSHHQQAPAHGSQDPNLLPSSSFGSRETHGSAASGTSGSSAHQSVSAGSGYPTQSNLLQGTHSHSDPNLTAGVGDWEDNLTFWDGQEALLDYGQGGHQHASGAQGVFSYPANAFHGNQAQGGYPQTYGTQQHFSAALSSQERAAAAAAGGLPNQGQSGYSSAPSSGQLTYGMSGPGSMESRAPFPASNSLLVPGGGNKSNNMAGNRTNAGGSGAAFGLGISPYESGYGMSGGSNTGHFFSGSFSSASSSFAQPTLGSSYSSQGNGNWGSSYSSSMEQGSAFSSSYDQLPNPTSYGYGGAGSAGSAGSYSALQTSGLPPLSSYLVSPSSSDHYLKRVPQSQQQSQAQQSSFSQHGNQQSSHTSPPSSRTFRRQHDSIQ